MRYPSQVTICMSLSEKLNSFLSLKLVEITRKLLPGDDSYLQVFLTF